MTHSAEDTKKEDDAAQKFYGDVTFSQDGDKLDAMKESQEQVERDEADANED